jgi:hypothetical protein
MIAMYLIRLHCLINDRKPFRLLLSFKRSGFKRAIFWDFYYLYLDLDHFIWLRLFVEFILLDFLLVKVIKWLVIKNIWIKLKLDNIAQKVI